MQHPSGAGRINDASLQHQFVAYRHENSYDPNMGSTAERSSPTSNLYLNHLNPPSMTQSLHHQNGHYMADSYGNFIILSETGQQQEEQRQQEQQQHNSTNLTDFIEAFQMIRSGSNQLRTNYNSISEDQEIQRSTHTRSSIDHESSGILYSNQAVRDDQIFVQEGNYQNYYSLNHNEIHNTSAMVQVMNNNQISLDNHRYVQHQQQSQYNFHNNSNDIGQNSNRYHELSENTSTPSNPIANFSEGDFISPSVPTRLISEREANDHHQKRMYMESAMLPLLAAVNDITQRDPELQSYLNNQVNCNQSNESTTNDNLFDINSLKTSDRFDGKINEIEEHVHNEYLDINDVGQHHQVEKDNGEKELIEGAKKRKSNLKKKMKAKSTMTEEKLSIEKNISPEINTMVDEAVMTTISMAENKIHYDKDDDCLLIIDNPVESRARASLPTDYLYFSKIKEKSDKEITIVCAKREIPFRTKFGPFEGEIRCLTNHDEHTLKQKQQIQNITDEYHQLMIFTGNHEILDTSNEYTSNWMRFVRSTKTLSKQNLELFQNNSDGKIYFRCQRKIMPDEELCFIYDEQYATKYGLLNLSENCLKDNNSGGDSQKNVEICDKKVNHNTNSNQLQCFECNQHFQISEELQNHLDTHNNIVMVNDTQNKESQNTDTVEMRQEEQIKSTAKNRQHKKKKSLNKTINSLNCQQVSCLNNSSRCSYCFKLFMTTMSLEKHMQRHLNEKCSKVKNSSNQFVCKLRIRKGEKPRCYKNFSTEEKLKKHRLVHFKDYQSTNKYTCTQCGRVCTTGAAYSAHTRSHTSNAQYSFRCAYCSETFKSAFKLKIHIKNHSVSDYYPCHLCGKKYRTYNLARKHIRIFHPLSNVTHTCTVCNRQFVHVGSLRRHVIYCHSEKTDFLCSYCGIQFKRSDKLHEHIRKSHLSSKIRYHQQNKQQSIEKLKNVSINSNKVLLKKSKNSEINNKSIEEDYEHCLFKCHDCKLGFKRRGMFLNHMVKRHPQVQIDSIPELRAPILKQQSLFNCPYCSRVYKNNSKRKVHIIKAHPGQKLPPPIKNNTSLQELHAYTIGSVKINPYNCELCYKQYTSRNRLLAHYRKDHSSLHSAIIKTTKTMKNCEKLPQDKTNNVNENVNEYQTEHYDSGKAIESNINQFYSEHHQDYPVPTSPENKLLKLSSAALELSSLEDREFLDFLNARSRDQSPIRLNHDVNVNSCYQRHTMATTSAVLNSNSNGDDNSFDNITTTVVSSNAFVSRHIDDSCNFKIEGEFNESSSNTELINRLPRLFEEF